MFLGTILSINPKNNIYAMNAQWNKWIYIIGIILFFIGVLDPLEGSVIIALGCIFGSLATNAIYRCAFWPVSKNLRA